MADGLHIKLTADAAGVESTFNKVAAGLNAVTKSASTVRPGLTQASTALSNLGRVAQDLPFGFIAIQNNLSPLLESFQRMRAESGSNINAFKALGASLIGGGGVGLALSVGTALMTKFGSKLFEASEAVTKVKDRLKQLAEEQQSINKGLGEEMGNVQRLIGTLKDETQSRLRKITALKELKSINPEYFGQLSFEKGAVDGLSVAYDKYSANIFKLAKAKALQNRINENATAAINLEQSIEKVRMELAKLPSSARIGDVFQGVKQTTPFDNKNQVLKLLEGSLKLNQKEVDDLITKMNALGVSFDKVDPSPGFNKLKDVSKEIAVAWREIEAKVTKVQSLGAFADFTIKANLSKQAGGMPEFRMPEKSFKDLTEAEINILKVQAALNNLNNVELTAFNGLGESFSAFTNAVFEGENAFKAFGNSAKNVLKQVIAQLAATAAMAAALSLITGGLSRGGVSFGGAFKSFLGGGIAMPKLSGITGGSITAGMRDFGGRSSAAPVVLETVVRGRDLLLVQARASATQRRAT